MSPLTCGDSCGQPANSAVDEAPPSWAAPLIAALAKPAERGRPSGPRGNSRDRRPSSSSPSARQRSASPNSGFKPKGNFVWRGGCNHCNDKDHKGHECPKSKKIKRLRMIVAASCPRAIVAPSRSRMRNGGTTRITAPLGSNMVLPRSKPFNRSHTPLQRIAFFLFRGRARAGHQLIGDRMWLAGAGDKGHNT